MVTRSLFRARPIALVTLVSLSLLVAGCSAQEKASTSAGPPQKQAQEQEQAPKKPDPAGFFKGKVVEWIVPYGPGGGFDTYSRMIAPFLETELGSTVVIKNVAGGHSVIGLNELYKAKPDGLTIGIVNRRAMTLTQLTDDTGAVQYDLAKMSWLGRLTREARVLLVGRESGFQNLEDVIGADRTVRFGGSGEGILLLNALFFEALRPDKSNEIIMGYKTSEETWLALLRGELDGSESSLSSAREYLERGETIAIAQVGLERSPELADLPLLQEIPDLSDEGRKLLELTTGLQEMDRVVGAPPNLPPDRLEFLRESLKRALENPELKAMAEKQQMPIIYLDGEKTAEMVRKGVDVSEEVKQKLKELMDKYR